MRGQEEQLTLYTFKRFEELGEDIEVYGPRNVEVRGGVISFNIKGLHHHTVGKALDLMGIAVRTGMHCAHPLHYRLGLKGTVRASYYVYNTEEDVDALIEALKLIIKLRSRLAEERVEDVCTGD